MTTPSPQCPQCLRNISSKHSPERDQAVCVNRNCTLFLQRLNQQYPRDYFKSPRGNPLEEQILDRHAMLQAYQYRLRLAEHRRSIKKNIPKRAVIRIKLLSLQAIGVEKAIYQLTERLDAQKLHAAYRRSY